MTWKASGDYVGVVEEDEDGFVVFSGLGTPPVSERVKGDF